MYIFCVLIFFIYFKLNKNDYIFKYTRPLKQFTAFILIVFK